MSDKHDYDGIEELDNPMPDWWAWSFFICIMFAAFYVIHYFSDSGPTLLQEYEKDYAAHQAQYRNDESEELWARISETELLAKLADSDASHLGQEVYARSCQACHADQLQGLVGPNLTDEYWIHGNGLTKDILSVVRNGVLEKGMPAWKEQLNDEELVAVVAYIWLARGKQVPGAKAPQGNPYPDYLK